MATIEERFEMIQRSVLDQAEAEAKKLRDEAAAYKEAAMKKAETEVLQELYSRIQDFTKTPAYIDLMNEIAKELGARCPMEGTIVMLRREDYHLAAKLGEHFGKNVRILAEEAIHIGGIKVMNQSSGIFLDETLDSRLEDQKPWFYSHSGLTIA